MIRISQNDFALIFCGIYLMLKVFRLSNAFEINYMSNFRHKFRSLILGDKARLEESSGEYEYFVEGKFFKYDYLINEIIYTSFVIYLIFLVSKIYFPMNISLWGLSEYRFPRIWLRPLWSLQQVYNVGGIGGLIYQIGGNLILLTPLAFYMLYFRSDKFITLKDVLILCFKVTLCIETSQVLLSLIIPSVQRYFEINDIICNTLGGIIGFGIYKLFIFLLNKCEVLRSENEIIS